MEMVALYLGDERLHFAVPGSTKALCSADRLSSLQVVALQEKLVEGVVVRVCEECAKRVAERG